jgi:sulfur carrier protein ThiS
MASARNLEYPGRKSPGKEERMNRFRGTLVPLMTSCILAVSAVGCSVGAETVDQVRGAVDLLPRGSFGAIPIHIDEEGRISRIAGFDTAIVDRITESWFEIGRFSVVNEQYLTWLVDSNVQHITVAFRPEGLFVMVNGEPLPYLAWNDETIANLIEVLEMFERDGQGAYLLTSDMQDHVADLLPWLPTLGLEIRVELPTPDNVERIPAPGEIAFEEAIVPDVAPENRIGPTVLLDIDYVPLEDDMGWVPSVSGLSTVDVNQILTSMGMGMKKYRLRRDIEARLVEHDVDGIGIEARADGVFFAVDGKLLPHLAWSDLTLTNLSALLAQLYVPGEDDRLQSSMRWVPVVRTTAPLLNDIELALQVKFPVGEAASR